MLLLFNFGVKIKARVVFTLTDLSKPLGLWQCSTFANFVKKSKNEETEHLVYKNRQKQKQRNFKCFFFKFVYI